ncbi:MAG: hypothetical protein ACK53Y_24155, partial [bacterium]
VEAPKISQHTLNNKMDGIRPVTPTEVEQMREDIFKNKESGPTLYHDKDGKAKNVTKRNN